MQITPEALQQFAESAVRQRIEQGSILAAYLCGSSPLPGSPLIGGTTDIDLVLIHTSEPQLEREIEPLTAEIHLDIYHHPQTRYRQGRELRVHPWLGPTLNNARPLYDPRHFLDFTQASVRGQFHRGDYKIARSRALLDEARQSWLQLQAISTATEPGVIARYLKAIENAANAVASLAGNPLTTRRLLLEFPQRAEALGLGQMRAGILGLLGAHHLVRGQMEGWLAAWEATCAAIPEATRPTDLHPQRRAYYLRACEAMLGSGEWQAALWPLLNTWVLAAGALPDHSPAYPHWQEAFLLLEIFGPHFGERVAALDAFLDQVAESLNAWEQVYGF